MTAADFWRWHPHPEVWLLVAALIGFGFYVSRVIGPKVVPAGEPAVTRRQRQWYVLAVAVLWVGSDWPIHDIGERYLYTGHMVQHLLFTIVAAPLFLLATPTWLARLVLGDGWFAGGVVRRLCHPVAAGVIYNAVFIFTHWQNTVNRSVQSAPLHFGLHALLMAAALVMWMPICGPLPERRLKPPAAMFYLFCQSILPTIPAAWLILADKPVYKVYDIPDRMFGWSVVTDQQLAGLLMKLGAGTYLWFLIVVLFFRWAADSNAFAHHPTIVRTAAVTDLTTPVAEPADAVAPAESVSVPTTAEVPRAAPPADDDVLTWAEVEAELARLPSNQPPAGQPD